MNEDIENKPSLENLRYLKLIANDVLNYFHARTNGKRVINFKEYFEEDYNKINYLFKDFISNIDYLVKTLEKLEEDNISSLLGIEIGKEDDESK